MTSTEYGIWKPRKSYTPPVDGVRYCLGRANDTTHYFYYELQKITTLNYDFLSDVAQWQGENVIYADCCSISSDELKELGITFKETPKDIVKL